MNLGPQRIGRDLYHGYLDLVPQRARDDPSLTLHERCEALLGRVVIVHLAYVRVLHAGLLEERRVGCAGRSEVTVTPVPFSSLRIASTNDCANALEAAYTAS